MDIGPVRRRFTAEPLRSPVPGEEPGVHEPPATARVTDDPATAPTRDTVPTTGARPEPSP